MYWFQSFRCQQLLVFLAFYDFFLSLETFFFKQLNSTKYNNLLQLGLNSFQNCKKKKFKLQ